MRTKTDTFKREQVRKEIKKQYADKISELEAKIVARNSIIERLLKENKELRNRLANVRQGTTYEGFEGMFSSVVQRAFTEWMHDSEAGSNSGSDSE